MMNKKNTLVCLLGTQVQVDDDDDDNFDKVELMKKYTSFSGNLIRFVDPRLIDQLKPRQVMWKWNFFGLEICWKQDMTRNIFIFCFLNVFFVNFEIKKKL